MHTLIEYEGNGPTREHSSKVVLGITIFFTKTDARFTGFMALLESIGFAPISMLFFSIEVA